MSSRTKQKEKVGEMEKGELETLITSAVQAATKSINSALQKISTEVSSLKKELKAKDDKIKELETRLENRIDELEQYGRRNNLRIFGIQEADTEDTDSIVIDVANKMGVSIDASCIDRSHRVGKKGSHDRPIIVKFTSYAYRSLLFKSKRQLKGTKVTVREDLTVQRLKLMKEAMAAYSVKKVWSMDGVIRVNAGLRYPLSVRNFDELRDLFAKHPPDGSGT